MSHTDLHAKTEERAYKSRPSFTAEAAKENGMTDEAIEAAQSIIANDESDKVEYPKNKAKTTIVGHKWEMNETEGNEYINLRHGLTGAYIKMFANGDVQVHAPTRDVNVFAARHINVKTGSTMDAKDPSKNDRLNINVTGNFHMEVEGDMHTLVKGNRYTTINGTDNLIVKDLCSQVYSDLSQKITGSQTVEASKYKIDASNIQRNLLNGGIMRDRFAGTYVIEQYSPGGCIEINSAGDIDLTAIGHIRQTTVSNLTFTVGGKVDYLIAGLRVTGSPTGVPTGPLSTTESSFSINCAAGSITGTALLGNINLAATVGTMQLFAGGAFLKVNCLTGVYLN